MVADHAVRPVAQAWPAATTPVTTSSSSASRGPNSMAMPGVSRTPASGCATPPAPGDQVGRKHRYDPAGKPHDKRPMLDPADVVSAVMFALTQPDRVNIDELRLSHS